MGKKRMFWWLPTGSKNDNVSQDDGEAKKKSTPKSKADKRTKSKKHPSSKKPEKSKKTAEPKKSVKKDVPNKQTSKAKAKTNLKNTQKKSKEPMTVSWTDERVETLKKLWTDGKSASEIAEELGNVTRNAVIGKAHRLGLSGRPSPIKKPAKKAAGNSKSTKTTDKGSNETKKTPKTSSSETKKTKAVKDTAPKQKPVEKEKPASKTEVVKPKAVPPGTLRPEPEFNPDDLVDLLELTERMCRWPSGDPKEGEFGFCGKECEPLIPYCKEHILMAYQSSSKKPQKAKIKKTVSPKEMVEDDDIDEEDLEDIEDIDPDEIDEMEDDDADLDDEKAL